MVFFSVVVPVYNRANLIQKTIDSILNQNVNNYEIIVVDDGSTDDTIDILQKYGNQIKLLTQQNQGPGKARNLAIENSHGDYIAFLDSDDIWFPWTLEVYEKVIEATNQPAFLAGKAIFFSDENDIKSIQNTHLNYRQYQDLYASSKEVTSFLTSSVVIRRHLIPEMGMFTNRWINSEDNDLWLRWGTAQGFIYINSPFVLAYRQHPHSAIAITTKTYEGTCYIIQQEQQHQYPGDQERKKERLEILTRHIRPVSLKCLDDNEIKKAWTLYQQTFIWHLYLGKFRYLIGFLWLTLRAIIQSSLK